MGRPKGVKNRPRDPNLPPRVPKARICKECGHPMKGHSANADCKRNAARAERKSQSVRSRSGTAKFKNKDQNDYVDATQADQQEPVASSSSWSPAAPPMRWAAPMCPTGPVPESSNELQLAHPWVQANPFTPESLGDSADSSPALLHPVLDFDFQSFFDVFDPNVIPELLSDDFAPFNRASSSNG